MNMDKANEWAGKLTEIYGDGYEVKPVESGGVIGFYLFTNGFCKGNLLCSDDTVSAFYEVENSDIGDKEAFYRLFRDDATDNYGLKETTADPDALTWMAIKEYVDSLTDRELDEEFLAFEDDGYHGETTEFRAVSFNRNTNSLIIR